MLSHIINFIKNSIQRIFFPIIFNLEEEYLDVLLKEKEVKLRNVLVGTVKTREQLAVNLNKKFYHIPLKEILTEAGIEFIALYQSKNLFNHDNDINGIKYFGKVSKVSVVPRNTISEIPKDSHELYVRFDIEEWLELDPHVKIRETYPKVFLKTSEFLLKESRYTNVLSIESVDEYVLYSGVCDIACDLYDGFVFREYHCLKRGKKIIIKKNKRNAKINISTYNTVSLSEFREALTSLIIKNKKNS